MPDSSAVEPILRAIVEAMEQREAAEPDLPEWEATARLRAAEASLMRLYRQTPHRPQTRAGLGAIEIVTEHENTAVEVA